MKTGMRLILLLFWLCVVNSLYAQNYSAIHGSNYSGSLGVYNNPSSIVNTPYKWDLTLFGTQMQTISDALSGRNFPLYFLPSSKFKVANGDFVRNVDFISNLRLLNARYAINKSHTIAFGANIKTYTQVKSGQINYNDTIKGARTFLYYNESNSPLEARMSESSWAELYGSYAFTLWDREDSRLNVGATLKILRGLSGAYARLSDVRIERQIEEDQIVDYIKGGAAEYGLSATHGDATTFNISEMFRLSQAGIAGDIGIEYLVKSQAVSTVFDEDNYYEYDWKIGVSLLDLGWNKFSYNTESRSVAGLKDDVSGSTLQEKFNSVETLASFNDSLETIVNQSVALRGFYNIYNPARAVINVDRYMWDNFFINGELSVNLIKDSKKQIAVAESKLVTITPRWERRKFGVYIPVQVTRYGNFWIGGALRAGPLLIGTHNILNALSSKGKLSGGGYIAITLRPKELMSGQQDKRLNCPTF